MAGRELLYKVAELERLVGYYIHYRTGTVKTLALQLLDELKGLLEG